MQRDDNQAKTHAKNAHSVTLQAQSRGEEMIDEAQIRMMIEAASNYFDELAFSKTKEEILANAIHLYKCCNLLLAHVDLDTLPIHIKNEIATKIVFYLGYTNYITFCLSKEKHDFNLAHRYFCDADRSGYVEAKCMLIILMQEQDKIDSNNSEENEKKKKELLVELIHHASKDGLKLPIQDKTELFKIIFDYLNELKNKNNAETIKTLLAFLALQYKAIPYTDYDYGRFYIEYGKILEMFASPKDNKLAALLYFRAYMQWQESGLELLIEYFKNQTESGCTEIRGNLEKLRKIKNEKLYNKESIILLEEIIHGLDRYFNNQQSKPDSRLIVDIRLTLVDFLIAQVYNEDCPCNYSALEKANELLTSINTDSPYKKILKSDLEEKLNEQTTLNKKKKSAKSKKRNGKKNKKNKAKVEKEQAVSQQNKTIKRTARKHDQHVSSASADIKQTQKPKFSEKTQKKQNPKTKSTKKKKNQKQKSQQVSKKKQEKGKKQEVLKKENEEVQVTQLGLKRLEKPLILIKSEEKDHADEKSHEINSELNVTENEKVIHEKEILKENVEINIESSEHPIQLSTPITKLLNDLSTKYTVAYLVGSQVRDRHQYREAADLEAKLANHDIDLVVPLPKETLDEVLSIGDIDFQRKVIDTKRVIYENKAHNIQIYFSPYLNENPQSLIKDAEKRDFTINALYADVNGKLYDPTGRGIRDLLATMPLTVTKPPYDLVSMARDPIRIFRLLHLYVLGYKKTYPLSDLSKIYKYLNKEYGRINDDQLYYRLDKHFMGGQAVASFDLLSEYKLINYIFPGIRGGGLSWLRKQLLEADNRVKEGFHLSQPRLYMNFLAARIISEIISGQIRHIDQIDHHLIDKLMEQFRFPIKLKDKIKNYVSYDFESYIQFIKQQAAPFTQRSDVLHTQIISPRVYRKSKEEPVLAFPHQQSRYLTPPFTHHRQFPVDQGGLNYLSIHQEYEHSVIPKPSISGPSFVQIPPAPVYIRRPLPAAPISLTAQPHTEMQMPNAFPQCNVTNQVRYPVSPSYSKEFSLPSSPEQKGRELSQNPFSLFAKQGQDTASSSIPIRRQHALSKGNLE